MSNSKAEKAIHDLFKVEDLIGNSDFTGLIEDNDNGYRERAVEHIKAATQEIDDMMAAEAKASPEPETQLTLQLRDILSKVLIDGQNQIHDLKDGKATPEEVTERMFASIDYWTPKAEALFQQALTSLKTEMEKKKIRYSDENLPKYLQPANEAEKATYWKEALRHEQGFNEAISECQRLLEGLK